MSTQCSPRFQLAKRSQSMGRRMRQNGRHQQARRAAARRRQMRSRTIHCFVVAIVVGQPGLGCRLKERQRCPCQGDRVESLPRRMEVRTTSILSTTTLGRSVDRPQVVWLPAGSSATSWRSKRWPSALHPKRQFSHRTGPLRRRLKLAQIRGAGNSRNAPLRKFVNALSPARPHAGGDPGDWARAAGNPGSPPSRE